VYSIYLFNTVHCTSTHYIIATLACSTVTATTCSQAYTVHRICKINTCTCTYMCTCTCTMHVQAVQGYMHISFNSKHPCCSTVCKLHVWFDQVNGTMYSPQSMGSVYLASGTFGDWYVLFEYLYCNIWCIVQLTLSTESGF